MLNTRESTAGRNPLSVVSVGNPLRAILH
ncbi:unnamed protein product [Gulo gulo]|uniref:Uncharacterized protein n=1 Tax=Gulo gulo TaxID=48420 RepID=A0A9X9M4Z3_GULGU|nr:unnamed protein product [Gulo gulo]